MYKYVCIHCGEEVQTDFKPVRDRLVWTYCTGCEKQTEHKKAVEGNPNDRTRMF